VNVISVLAFWRAWLYSSLATEFFSMSTWVYFIVLCNIFLCRNRQQRRRRDILTLTVKKNCLFSLWTFFPYAVKDFEMAVVSANKMKVLQTWC
jgi:hypothetical protein